MHCFSRRAIIYPWCLEEITPFRSSDRVAGDDKFSTPITLGQRIRLWCANNTHRPILNPSVGGTRLTTHKLPTLVGSGSKLEVGVIGEGLC